MLGDKTTRERRHERTRKQILSAAKRLLRKKGIEKFSLRGVAAECDYSPAGLYEYFKSKNDLLTTIAKDIELDLRSELLKVGIKADLDALMNLGLRYIRFAKNHPEDYLLLFTTFSSGRRGTEETLPDSSAYMVLYNLVSELVEQEQISLKDALGVEEICYNYWILLHGHVMMQLTHLKGFQAEFEQVEQSMLSRFVKSLR